MRIPTTKKTARRSPLDDDFSGIGLPGGVTVGCLHRRGVRRREEGGATGIDRSNIANALAGRIVVLEAILIALCTRLGPTAVSAQMQPLLTHDSVIRVCFSSGNPDPRDALLSYYQNLVTELDPLVLWQP